MKTLPENEGIYLFKNLFLHRNAHLHTPNMYSGPSVMQNFNWIKNDDGTIPPTPCHTTHTNSDQAKLQTFYVLGVSWDDTTQHSIGWVEFQRISVCSGLAEHTPGLKSWKMLTNLI